MPSSFKKLRKKLNRHIHKLSTKPQISNPFKKKTPAAIPDPVNIEIEKKDARPRRDIIPYYVRREHMEAIHGTECPLVGFVWLEDIRLMGNWE